ncbi:MAG: hypothetical protein AAB919_02600 [Patescibacteria group bacterium]
MSKVYIFIGVVAVAAAASFAGGAYWAQTSLDAAPGGVLGRVTARDASSLTIQLSGGVQKTFSIGSQTSFAEVPPALTKVPADATVGMLVKVFSTGGGVANSVLLLSQSGATTTPGTL